MNSDNLKEIWKNEERIAHIHGWDFAHIDGRCEEADLPWDYKETILRHLRDDMEIMDYDTGGGEFLLSLEHPHHRTSATEGYPPNVELCTQTLLPLGIHFRQCDDPACIPFPDESFDMILNRHGDLHPRELYRLLKKGGMFITQQVGAENDRDLVQMVLPDAEKPFPHCTLKEQKEALEDAGFQIIEAAEAFRPVRFYDVGAFVWFARVLPWEFPGFSVDSCLEGLLQMQKTIEDSGKIEGTIHRFLLVAKK